MNQGARSSAGTPDLSRGLPAARLAGWREGVREGLALAFSAMPWGVVFGLLAQSLFDFWRAFMMSAYVFSGTAQFVAMDQWRAGAAVGPMLVAMFAVNARYLLQGMTLQPYLRSLRPLQQVGALATITDMSWALSLPRLRAGQAGPGYLVGASLIIYSGWVLGTVIGYWVPLPLDKSRALGLDFAVSAALIGLAAGQFRGRSSLLPWGVAIGVAVLGRWIMPPSASMMLGGIVGALAGAWRDTR